MNCKLGRLGWLILLPGLLILVGLLLLQAQDTVTVAQGPVAQAAWPPMQRYLSNTARQAKVRDLDANSSGLLVTWSEGDLSANGQFWMGWHNKSTWSLLRIDNVGGYTVTSGVGALNGTTAHFAWVGSIPGVNQYRIFYRARNLSTGAWSATEYVYPASGDEPSTDKLQDVQIAIDASGAPHVVWVRNETVLSELRDRVYYSNRTGGTWSVAAKISGVPGTTDNKSYAEDMPALVTKGSDIYITWREKSAGDTSYGLYFRHRTSAGVWEPADQSGLLRGKRISTHRYDEFPSMAAVGDRVYVMWDRWLATDCNSFGQNCYQVYSMTHRVLTGANISTDWWPADSSRDMLTGDGQPIVAYSSLIESSADPLGAPLPDDYYSGVRPSIQVVRVGTAYRPCVAWHHWENEGNKSATVNDTAPYRVHYSCVEEGDLESARWEDYGYQVIKVLGRDSIFTTPLLALTANSVGGYDLHVALNGRQGATDTIWGAAYANTYEYYFSLFPTVLKNYR